MNALSFKIAGLPYILVKFFQDISFNINQGVSVVQSLIVAYFMPSFVFFCVRY